MKNLLRLCHFLGFFLLFAAYSCKKDFAAPENSLSSREGTEGVFQSDEDEIDSVFEFYDDERDTLGFDETDYNANANVTTITSILGAKALGSDGIELDCPGYKYYGRYIASNEGNWFDITLNRDDSIRNVANYGDGIIFDSLYQIDGKHLKCRIRAEKDTLQTKTSAITLFSKKPWANGTFPSIRRKMKFVGKIGEHLYGTNNWMTDYWRFFNGTQHSELSALQTIDPSYIAQIGDILVWADGHTGTIMPIHFIPSRIVAATKTVPAYRENRFWLSEMNSRCKGEKTVKAIRMKSYKIPQTLLSANKSHGTPTQYYRVH